MGGLIRSSMKFLSPEVALYVSKSTIRPCMEYCCHVWVGTPSRYLKLLSYQNGYVGLLVHHLLLLLNPWFIAKRQPAYIFYIGIALVDAHLNWLNWSHCLILEEGLLVILIHDFSFSIPRCYNDVYVNSFFLCTASLWNSLSIEYFPLIYDITVFKSRINRLFLTVVSFQIGFMYALIFFFFFFL